MIGTILFIIFFLVDVMVLGLTAFVRSGKENYERGMILGVHIPEERAKDEAVRQIVCRYKKMFKRYMLWNTAASFLVTAFCFIQMGVFVLLWFLWILEYAFGLQILMWAFHKKLYDLKIKNGWGLGEAKAQVRIDTKLTASAEKFPLKWIWTFLPVIFSTALLFIPQVRMYFKNETGHFLLPVSMALVSVMFFALHLYFAGMRHTVYSMDSEVNMRLNRLKKRSWSVMLAADSYVNLAAWLYIAVRIILGGSLFFWDYIIYAAVQMMGAFIVIVGLIAASQEGKRILQSDTVPVIDDEDQWWKYGWYSNPYDKRLFVANWLDSSGYTMNMAKPAAKVWVAVMGCICIAALCVCVFVAVMLTKIDNTDIQLYMEGNTIKIDGGLYSCEFVEDDIESVRLLDGLPDENFRKTNGADTDTILLGHFKGKETGNAEMFIYRNQTPVIMIELKDKSVFLNSENPDVTYAWYEKLKTV